MDEIKRMLEVLHKENKEILALLWCDANESCEIGKFSKMINDKFDSLFYEKEGDSK